jgi:sigma-B regulation protein RsbU (phosphoserine phosphatase)
MVLTPGDVLVIYSDGVAEAMNADEEQFGEQRLEEVVRKHRRERAGEIIAQITAAVKSHTGTHPQYDDMTLVVLKRTEV